MQRGERLATISLEEEKVNRLKKILNRALSRTEVDDDEVWDARECLRLAHMEAGNYHLWENKSREKGHSGTRSF